MLCQPLCCLTPVWHCLSWCSSGIAASSLMVSSEMSVLSVTSGLGLELTTYVTDCPHTSATQFWRLITLHFSHPSFSCPSAWMESPGQSIWMLLVRELKNRRPVLQSYYPEMLGRFGAMAASARGPDWPGNATPGLGDWLSWRFMDNTS